MGRYIQRNQKRFLGQIKRLARAAGEKADSIGHHDLTAPLIKGSISRASDYPPRQRVRLRVAAAHDRFINSVAQLTGWSTGQKYYGFVCFGV